jgi:hypothetical protein
VSRKLFAGLFWALVPVAWGADEAVKIEEPVHAGSQVKTKLHLVLRGTIQVDKKEMNVAGQALLVYPERVLAVGNEGTATEVARFYEDARAKFVTGQAEDPRQIRSDMRLALGQSTEKGLELWSPSGPYSSDETELIQDVLDTTQLPAFLPKKEVKKGDKWDPPQTAQARACDLEEFITSTIECTLKELTEEEATIGVSGKIHGLSFGSEVKSNIDATITFDRQENLITKVEWKQIDSRAPSPVSPAGAYEAMIKIERSAGESPNLADGAIANLNTKPDESELLLSFEDPEKRFRFLHDRNWHVTLMEKDRAILRRLIGRNMVSQLNISVIAENKNIANLTAEQLQAMIIQAGDIKIDEVVRSEDLQTDGPFQVRVVRAKGTKGNVELVQRHYVASDSTGRQLLFSFLTEPDHEAELGDRDLALVQSLDFAGSTASKKTTSPK